MFFSSSLELDHMLRYLSFPLGVFPHISLASQVTFKPKESEGASAMLPQRCFLKTLKRFCPWHKIKDGKEKENRAENEFLVSWCNQRLVAGGFKNSQKKVEAEI